MSNREAAAASERLSEHDVLELIRDLSSQEWQDASGKRFGATDNQGRRLWFISEDVMREVRAALASAPQAVRMLTEDEVLSCFQPHWAKIDAAPNIQRKFCEVNGLGVPLAPQDSTKEGT